MNEQKRKRMLRIACLLLAGVCTLAAGQYFHDAAVLTGRKLT